MATILGANLAGKLLQNWLVATQVATELSVATFRCHRFACGNFFFCHGSLKSCHSSRAGLLLVLVPLCLCLSPVSVSLLRVCVSRLCLCLSPVPVAARFCFYDSSKAKKSCHIILCGNFLLPQIRLWQLMFLHSSRKSCRNSRAGLLLVLVSVGISGLVFVPAFIQPPIFIGKGRGAQ